jgi:hypothetical protein
MEHTNYSTVTRFVKDGLEVLRSSRVQEEKVLVLYLDATADLKVFYQNLIHFTCMAHGLQSVAE